MKITKKIIILLIVLVGMLILGMSEVNAENYLPDGGKKVNISDLKKNTAKNINRYFIGYSQHYQKYSNLYCAQKGQRLWSSRYTL